MYLNRIFLVCITGFIFILGCGGPSATDIYELERRISANEKNHSDAEASLKAASKVEHGTEQLAQLTSTAQAMDQRLTTIETRIADLSKQLKATESGQTKDKSLTESSRLARLENRIDELEKSLTDRIKSIEPLRPRVRPPVADGKNAATDTTNMADNSKVEKKSSSNRNNRRKPRDFEITLFSWNVESEGSDPKVIAKQLSETNRYDVYGLCEVLPEAIELYTNALGGDYRTIASRSGFNDRLQIIYNTKKFELLQRLELKDINFEYRYRSPLVAHLRDKATKQQFMVVNNHLARGREEVRTRQAEQLVDWARDQNVPVIAIGDYNFDYVFRTRKGNDGFNAMLQDNIWKWVEPVDLIDTNWFDNPKNPDGRDDYEGSMLDFAFVAGAATQWKSECRIIVRPGDFPDDDKTSDHRPFELRLSTL